jgi:hydrogenase-4 component B
VLGTLLFLYLRRRQSLLPVASGPTWGCGYLRPTPRMQYTASSFGLFFGTIAAPMIRTRIKKSGALLGVAPATGRLAYLPEETLLHRIIMPVLSVFGMAFSYLRRLQHGEVQIYILYIFATLFVLMLWVR